MNRKIILPLLAAAVPVLGTGCATNAHYVSSSGNGLIVNVGQINIQDFANAANAAIDSMLDSAGLAHSLNHISNPPAILAISRIANDTDQQIDIDLLTKKIRIALNDSGKFVTTTTFGLGGTAEDPLAKGTQQEREFMSDQKATRLPDYTLSGKIIQTRAQAGNTRQSTYSFQLSLTDKSGLAVWEGEREITKQGTRPVVGF